MMEENRQLAAILFSDIVGYTAMMGKDESDTLKLVRKNKEIQQPLIEKHHGIWLKEMGDGAMAQFKSALDAVSCAIEIQQLAKSELQAQLRIGIHLGDITIENGEIYGDGVNVASRIESIADPGSVFISDAVYGAIKGRSDIFAEFKGKKNLKNVDEPVKVYKVLTERTTASSSFGVIYSKYILSAILLAILVGAIVIWQYRKSLATGSQTTIAVLPLKLVNRDTSNQYLVQGITDELIRSLGKVNTLSVINPLSTSIRYQASLAPIDDARAELEKANFFVTGTLEKKVNVASLTIELTDKNGRVIWSNDFARDISQLPELAGQITVDIANQISIDLNKDQIKRITDIKPVDPEIYAYWLKGMNHISKLTQKDMAQAVVYLREATDRNPADARAWAGLAEGLVNIGHSAMAPGGIWKEAKAAAIRAIQLDSLNAEAWAALGHTKTYFEWDYDGAEYCYQKANELNPSMAMNHYHQAWHYQLFDSLSKAIEEHKLAKDLDPFMPMHTAWLGYLFMLAGDYEKAVDEAKQSMEIVPDFRIGYLVMGNVFLKKEMYDSALIMFQRAMPLGIIGMGTAYFRSGDFDKGMNLIQSVEQQPMNSLKAFALATIYSEIDSLDRFFQYANYEPPSHFAPWFRVNIENPKVIKDPRFKQLMDKMNLPMPMGYN
jgi:adenylate cyclase